MSASAVTWPYGEAQARGAAGTRCAVNPFEAFYRVHEIANGRRIDNIADPSPRGCAQATKTPFLRHGVKTSRKGIETRAQWSPERALTPRLLEVDELYTPSPLDS